MTKLEREQAMRIQAMKEDMEVLKNLLFLAHHEGRTDAYCRCGTCEQFLSMAKEGTSYVAVIAKDKIREIDQARQARLSKCPACDGTRFVIEYGDGESMRGAPCPECKGEPAPIVR